MRNYFCTAVLASLVLGAIPSAHAQDQSGPPQGGNARLSSGRPFVACYQDAQTFCKGIQPGGGRIKNCLEDHYKEISQDCYDLLQSTSSNGPPPHDGPPPPPDGASPDNGSPPPSDDNNGPPPRTQPGDNPDNGQ